MGINPTGGSTTPSSAPENSHKNSDEEKELEDKNKGFVLGGSNIGQAPEGGNKAPNKSLAERFGKGGSIKVTNSGSTNMKPQAGDSEGETGAENAD